MSDKNKARLRRARRSRVKIRELGVDRLSVNRTPRHIYAQILSANGDRVIAAASRSEEHTSNSSHPSRSRMPSSA